LMNRTICSHYFYFQLVYSINGIGIAKRGVKY
jgi:hypothetical protein